MATICHQIGIAASLEQVQKAISTTTGVSGWWTKTTGHFEPGGNIEFDFDGFKLAMTVSALQDDKVSWLVNGGDVDDQWQDTSIIFELEQRDNQVLVNFKHDGWREQTSFFGHCSTKWAVFLLSLKEYVETGTGRPFPDDIHINHD